MPVFGYDRESQINAYYVNCLSFIFPALLKQVNKLDVSELMKNAIVWNSHDTSFLIS